MKIRIGSWNLAVGTIAVAVIGVALLGAAGIAGWEYSNSNAFCAAMCHGVHPEEIAAHKQGAHARVNCVECHMGRNSTLHLMALKPTHAKELWGMIVGYERPITSGTLRPSREACESCHYPAVEHHDSVAVKVQYGTDPAEQRIAHQDRPAHRHGCRPHGLHQGHPLAHPERGALRLARPAAARDSVGRSGQGRRHQGRLHRRRNQAHARSRSRRCRRGRWPATTATTRSAIRSPTRRRWSTRPSAPARSTASCPTPRRAPWP